MSDEAAPEAAPAEKKEYPKNKIVYGILGILLGGWGIHRFYIGDIKWGVITLIITLCTFGIGALIMYIIGIVTGIMALMKTDEEFHQRYVVEKKLI